MPTYLAHGFRWPRPLIRIHIILQDLEDAAAEWLMAPVTTELLIDNFSALFPDAMPHLPNLRFLEQYDPEDLSPSAITQPYAYVADMVEEVRLGLDVDEVRGRGVPNDQWAALMEIRDKVAPDQKLGWFVVVCGDEERAVHSPEPDACWRGGLPGKYGREARENRERVEENRGRGREVEADRGPNTPDARQMRGRTATVSSITRPSTDRASGDSWTDRNSPRTERSDRTTVSPEQPSAKKTNGVKTWIRARGRSLSRIRSRASLKDAAASPDDSDREPVPSLPAALQTARAASATTALR